VGSRAGLDTVVKRNIPSPCRDSNPWSSSQAPLVSGMAGNNSRSSDHPGEEIHGWAGLIPFGACPVKEPPEELLSDSFKCWDLWVGITSSQYCYINIAVHFALIHWLIPISFTARPFPAAAADFFLHHSVQNGSGAHPASYPMGTRGYVPGGKAVGAWSWPHLHLVSRSNNAWSYTSAPPIRLQGMVLS
jgi:hypothetical protein